MTHDRPPECPSGTAAAACSSPVQVNSTVPQAPKTINRRSARTAQIKNPTTSQHGSRGAANTAAVRETGTTLGKELYNGSGTTIPTGAVITSFVRPIRIASPAPGTTIYDNTGAPFHETHGIKCKGGFLLDVDVRAGELHASRLLHI